MKNSITAQCMKFDNNIYIGTDTQEKNLVVMGKLVLFFYFPVFNTRLAIMPLMGPLQCYKTCHSRL